MTAGAQLLAALSEPGSMARLDLADWNALVPVARRHGVLGRLAWLVRRDGVSPEVPAAPAAHLRWAARVAEACAREVRYEARLIAAALAGVETEVVLLKGAAYVVGGYAAGGGRFFQDTDILVRESALPRVEIALMRAGWHVESHDAYDQRYYREWMHELPPLRHVRRGTALDVHYNILPRIGRLRPDAGRILAASRPVDAEGRLRVPAPADLILHSAAHLFQNGEFEHGLRDLSDLQLLVAEHVRDDEAWRALVDRAEALDLLLPLHCGLVLLEGMLGVAVPAVARERLARALPRGGAGALPGLFRAALTPAPQPQWRSGAGAASRAALYVRSHWVRMPPTWLVWHLVRKAVKRPAPVAARQH